MKRSSKRAVACSLALVFLAAACGDDSSTSTATSTTAASGGATGATNAAGTCHIDRPLRFVGLAEKRGESSAAIDDFDEGWQLAVDEINAAGGVCGQKIEYTRIATSPTDANQAKNAFLSALDKKADFVSGPISSTTVLGISSDVKTAGVPVLYMATAPQAFVGAEAGSEWGFVQRPRNSGIADIVAEYAVKDLGKTKIGLLCVDQPYGTQGCDAAQKKIESLGAQVVDRETNSATATDMTSQVLAIKSKGADAVLSLNFPNPMVLFYNQAADNGFNVPIFGFTSAGIGVASGGVKPNALQNVWGTDDCAPAGDPSAKQFADAYQAKYGKKLPGSGYTVAESYDAVKIAAQAVTTSGSLDPKKIADTMRSETFDGVCENYKADAGQGMHHSSVITQFDTNGLPQVRKTVAITG
jgi:branched-chain amino acid transport system substrate-binding protein